MDTVAIKESMLLHNALSTLAIAIGVTYSERSIKSTSVWYAIAAFISLLVGWGSFLMIDSDRNMGDFDMRLPFALIIPLSSIIAQAMQRYRLTTGLYKMFAAINMLAYCIGWVTYLLRKSRNNEGDLDKDVLKYNLIGHLTLVSGKIWYIFMDPHRLDMGDTITFLQSNIYNPSLVLVAAGWGILGIGNSFHTI